MSEEVEDIVEETELVEVTVRVVVLLLVSDELRDLDKVGVGLAVDEAVAEADAVLEIDSDFDVLDDSDDDMLDEKDEVVVRERVPVGVFVAGLDTEGVGEVVLVAVEVGQLQQAWRTARRSFGGSAKTTGSPQKKSPRNPVSCAHV